MREVREASAGDVILTLIGELAEYERLSHEVVATEDALQEWLFGEKAVAEVLIAEVGVEAVGFALFLHSFSTFLGKPGIYLEDLYVRPAFRGRGVGKTMLMHLAKLAKDRGCGRLEWSVLDWNESSIRFYESLGAVAMDDWTVYRVTGEALGRLTEDIGRPPYSRSKRLSDICRSDATTLHPDSVSPLSPLRISEE